MNGFLKFSNSPIQKQFQIMEEKAFWNVFDALLRDKRVAYGPDLYFAEPHSEALSMAHFVSACAGSPFFSTGRVQAAYRAALDWLLGHCDRDPEGFPGWGMTGAWGTAGEEPAPPFAVNYFITAVCIETLTQVLFSGHAYRREDTAATLERVVGDVLERGCDAEKRYFYYSPRPRDRAFSYYVNAVMAYAVYLYALVSGRWELSARGTPLIALLRGAALKSWADRAVRMGIFGYPALENDEEIAEKIRPTTLLHGTHTVRALFFLGHCGVLEAGPGFASVLEALRRYVDVENIELCEYPCLGRDGEQKTARLPGVGIFLGALKEMINLSSDPILKDSFLEFRCFALNVLFQKYTDRNLAEWRYEPDQEPSYVPRALACVLRGFEPFVLDPRPLAVRTPAAV